MELKKELIKVGDIHLNVFTAGPSDGEGVVVLHGFPENAKSFENQIQLLASQGFFVMAPDQRGYGDSDKPKKIRDYKMEFLAGDIIGMLNHYKKDRVYLLGHDWGSAIGWFLITFYEERFKKAILMSSPHWEVFKHHLLTNPKQIAKSWYMFLIMLPKIPEGLMSSQYFLEALGKSALNRPYPKENLLQLKKEWEEKMSLSSMLNWYRAMKDLKAHAPERLITVPTTLVWGARDPFLGESMAHDSLERCEKGNLMLLKGTGHWPHHENPEEIKGLLLSYFLVSKV